MSAWRVVRHYGHGAGFVPICAPALPRRVEPRPLREGLRDWRRDGAAARSARAFGLGLAPLLATALALWTVLPPIERPDEVGIRIATFEQPKPLELARTEPAAPLPDPAPVVPEPALLPKPAPVPEPALLPKPAPAPRVTAAPEPRPLPALRPEPVPRPQEPARALPQIDRVIARATEPPLSDPQRSTRRTEPARPALAPPPVAIDRIGSDALAPEPVRRTERPLAVPFALARAGRPAPSLASVAAFAAPAALAEEETSQRSVRERPGLPERRASPARPQALPGPDWSALPGAPSAPGHGALAPAGRATSTPPADRGRPQAKQRPGDAAIPGVPLGSLAPCVRDARELALKQRVVAAAENRASCESPAGRFHFVETKNVNAFLMGIEPAAGRDSGDRCEELAFALDCIANSSPRSRR